MLTNKDIRVENGNIVINGDKYPLDGQSPETIMEIVEDNSDTTPTENSTAPVTSGGVFNALANKLNISNVRSGRSTFPAAEATGNQTMQINFSTPLEHAPFILVSWDDNPDLASYFKYPLRITDVNVNGFKVTAERLIATSEWHIRWIAIDM